MPGRKLSQLLTTLTHFPNDRPATKGTFGTMTNASWTITFCDARHTRRCASVPFHRRSKKGNSKQPLGRAEDPILCVTPNPCTTPLGRHPQTWSSAIRDRQAAGAWQPWTSISTWIAPSAGPTGAATSAAATQSWPTQRTSWTAQQWALVGLYLATRSSEPRDVDQRDFVVDA